MLRITAELADLLQQASTEATTVIRNARRALPRTTGRARGRLRRAVNDLDVLLRRAAQVIAQTRIRLGGGTPTRRPGW